MATLVQKLANLDRRLVLRGLGLFFLLLGLAGALIGPLEMYTFYAFSEGGKFYYEGFGFGSFMFAYIAVQVAAYYVIAVLGIVLGYGHLTLRRWTQPLVMTFLGFWLLAGLPLTAGIYIVFLQSKVTELGTVLITLPLTAVLYPIAPLVLVWFYRSKGVWQALSRHSTEPSWLEEIPLAVRVLCLLLVFYIFLLHGPIFLNGIFPWFGAFIVGMSGVMALGGLIVVLGVLVWGLARQWGWAWWGSLIVFGAVTVSAAVTLPRYTVRDIMGVMDLPPAEFDMLRNVTFLDSNLALLALVPLMVTIGVLLAVRRYYYGGQVRPAQN